MAVLKYKSSDGSFQTLATGNFPRGNYVGETLVWDGIMWITKTVIWSGTQAEYDAITTKDPYVLYVVTG